MTAAPAAEALDRAVRRQAYDDTIASGRPPLAREVAARLSVAEADARASFERLAAGRVLVLQPGSGEILMLPPFSAVPTPFAVESGGRSYIANCIWDALGIPAMLKGDAAIAASCGCCGLAQRVAVEGGALHGEGVVHFAVPARRWWEDIVFT